MKTGKLPVFGHMQAAFYVTISAHWLIDWLVGLLIGLHNIFKTEGKIQGHSTQLLDVVKLW